MFNHSGLGCERRTETRLHPAKVEKHMPKLHVDVTFTILKRLIEQFKRFCQGLQTFLLYYTILCYAILYYTILYYTILYYTILDYTILYYTILYYTILYYTILYYTILYYTILYYTILYYITTILYNYYTI